MSTNALVTLHDLTDSGKNSFKTVTFYRHCDGYLGQPTASMFLNMFDNEAQAKGAELECFLANNAKDVDLSGFEEYSPVECCSTFHYHLDCKNLKLIVNNSEYNYTNDTTTETEVFNGCVTEYINQYLNANVCVLSLAAHCFGYSGTDKEVFTVSNMVRRMAKRFEMLDRLHKQGSSNPNNTNAVREINRYICFMGDMNLSKEYSEYRESSLKLILSYEELIFHADKLKGIQAAKDEANTTHVMMGDKPVSITILD